MKKTAWNTAARTAMIAVGLGILTANAVSTSAQAAVPHETFYYKGYPTTEQIALWSSLPGRRSYLLELEDPSAIDLEIVSQLRGADKIQLEVQRYPGEDSLPTWKRLAGQGVELVILNRPGLPTQSEIRRLNTAEFSRCVFVLGYYPDPIETARLGRINCKVSVTFATAAYPKSEDKPTLDAIPASTPLLFVSDYWPWYTHMDLLNRLPHTKSLRVSGMLPPDDSVQYLRGLKNLESVQLSTDFDPSDDEWKKFDGLPLTWISQQHVPSPQALSAFTAGNNSGAQARKLVIDSDMPWTDAEKALIQKSPLAVEWIRTAPDSWGSER